MAASIEIKLVLFGERRKFPDYLKESRLMTGRIRSSAYVERKLKRTFTGTSLRNRQGDNTATQLSLFC